MRLGASEQDQQRERTVQGLQKLPRGTLVELNSEVDRSKCYRGEIILDLG